MMLLTGPLVRNSVSILKVGGPKSWTPLTSVMREKTTSELPYPKQDIYTQKAINQPGKGKIYDKKPFKFYCEAGKTYLWCTCGYSHSQPFCDNHHKNPHFRIKLKPLVFKCEKSGEYWFCNCKQTKQRPFCDGTHRQPEIQAAVRS